MVISSMVAVFESELSEVRDPSLEMMMRSQISAPFACSVRLIDKLKGAGMIAPLPMDLNQLAQFSSSAPYTGPRDDDPLTEGELSLLLAIPRAAQSTPNATLFRLPLGPDPALGWIDVTCAETYSIVSRLAAVWRTRLSELTDEVSEPEVGPGTTICIVSHPPVHALFHMLAFWSLGCTVQSLSPGVSGENADAGLRQSGCKVLLHSCMSDAWVEGRKIQFKGKIVQLTEDEYAHRLAQAEKENSECLSHYFRSLTIVLKASHPLSGPNPDGPHPW